MSKSFFKHKLLLDENMPGRHEFPELNNHFDLKHIRDDFLLDGISDEMVYAFAVSEKRVIITRNIKHFLPLVGTKSDPGIIGIPPHWQPSQIDTKLVAFLKKCTPKMIAGNYKTI